MESAAFEAMKSPLIRITSDHQTEPAHYSSRANDSTAWPYDRIGNHYLCQQHYTLRRATYIATTINDLPAVIFLCHGTSTKRVSRRSKGGAGCHGRWEGRSSWGVCCQCNTY